MGQRTAILLKKNFGNNRSTISLIHHQWGIGKTMPAYLVQEVLKSCYPFDRSLGYLKDKMPIDVFFTFEPLSNERNNYITNKEVRTDDKNEDIWDSKVRIRYGNMTDNNNGMMLVEVTQNFDDDGKPKTFGDELSVKVGFCLGYEEIYFYHEQLNDSIPIEPEFSRLVSMKEYVTKTWRDDEYTNKFVEACRTILELTGEEVYDEEGAKRVEEKRNHIQNCIEALTKNVPDGQRIDVPKELLEEDKYYA